MLTRASLLLLSCIRSLLTIDLANEAFLRSLQNHWVISDSGQQAVIVDEQGTMRRVLAVGQDQVDVEDGPTAAGEEYTPAQWQEGACIMLFH